MVEMMISFARRPYGLRSATLEASSPTEIPSLHPCETEIHHLPFPVLFFQNRLATSVHKAEQHDSTVLFGVENDMIRFGIGLILPVTTPMAVKNEGRFISIIKES